MAYPSYIHSLHPNRCQAPETSWLPSQLPNTNYTTQSHFSHDASYHSGFDALPTQPWPMDSSDNADLGSSLLPNRINTPHMNEASHLAWGGHFFGCCHGRCVPQEDNCLASSLLNNSTHNGEYYNNGINSTPGVPPADISHNGIDLYGFPNYKQRDSSVYYPRPIDVNSSFDDSWVSQLPPVSQVNHAGSAAGRSRHPQTMNPLQRGGDQAFNCQLWETQIPIDPALQCCDETSTTSSQPITSPFAFDIHTATSTSPSNDSLHSIDAFEAGYLNAVIQNGIADGSSGDDSDSSVEPARQQTMNRSALSVLGDHTCPVCKAFTGGVKRLREHLRCHERDHVCPSADCDLRFSSLRDRDRHYKSVHQKAALKCSLCSTVIKGGREDNLQRHMRSFHSTHALVAQDLGE